MRFICTFACLLLISGVAFAGRTKRGITDCTKAVNECSETLDSRLGLNSKVQDTLKQDTPSVFQCCYLAEYNNCVENTKEECSALGSAILGGATKAVTSLAPSCSSDDYEYPSAKCIFFVWFYWIVGAIAAIILLSLICCVARCICGRN